MGNLHRRYVGYFLRDGKIIAKGANAIKRKTAISLKHKELINGQ